jgi:hypothetical protein
MRRRPICLKLRLFFSVTRTGRAANCKLIHHGKGTTNQAPELPARFPQISGARLATCMQEPPSLAANLSCQPVHPFAFAARMASPANNHSTAPAGYSFGYSVASSSTAFRVSELLVAGKLYRPPAGHTMPGRSSGSSRGDSRDLRARTNRAYSNNDVRPNTGRHASRWLIQGPR